MEKLESIRPGQSVAGIENAPVQIESIVWHGSQMLEVTYKTADSRQNSRFLLRADEPKLSLICQSSSRQHPCTDVKLLLETMRIRHAAAADPFLAVETSGIQPLPHQISAVYQEMLPRIPLRFLLADDPGAGKTIMTGLFIKELIAREGMQRCLIVCPGGLCDQWKDELEERFSLNFSVLTSRILKDTHPFQDHPFAIASVDTLARNEEYKKKLSQTEWDLIVVDEAHKLSATVWGQELKVSKRFRLGELLSEITKNFLLLTATPHNGKEEDFELFMSLLDKDRFAGASRHRNGKPDVSDLMRRMVKESLLKFDGTPLFPRRFSYTASYGLSDPERKLYEAVTDYVRQEYNRARKLEKPRRNAVGFAMTVLQRRLASSPAAIFHSLQRRREKLQEQLADSSAHRDESAAVSSYTRLQEEYSASRREELEDTAWATAAATREELEAEIDSLHHLENVAQDLCRSGLDRKWEELSRLLESSKAMRNPMTGQLEKLIIFTEHKDTLNYLKDRLTTLLGDQDTVWTISGSTSRKERRQIADVFRNDPQAVILLATDAAGEGINLQNAHLMINYDLPWNPNRLEQRFGRIHRIGQQHDCYLWNLCSSQTREGKVYARLLEKLETEKGALQGKVFDILGKLNFDNMPLDKLLMEAVSRNEDDEQDLLEIMDRQLDPAHLKELMEQESLTEQFMDRSQVFEIREEMERQEARKLQPHFIEACFLALLRHFGGRAVPLGNGEYRLENLMFLKDVPDRYQRVWFQPGEHEEGELIAPGHPLLEMLMDAFLGEKADRFKEPLCLKDPAATEEKTLYVLQGTIRDHEGKPVYQQLYYVLQEENRLVDGGPAPYLDYEEVKNPVPVIRDEKNEWKAQTWVLHRKLEPERQRLVKQREGYIRKARTAVRLRLTREIQYWDEQYVRLRVDDLPNAKKAEHRAQELEERLNQRMSRFDKEAKLTADTTQVRAVVRILPGQTQKPAENLAQNRKAMELAGMKAVTDIELKLGNVPRDVSKDNVGYDIESRSGNGTLRFIEVKARQKGADTVTVSRNEILTALNKPEDYILALVEVDGTKSTTTYMKQPFESPPDFSIASINYNIRDLKQQAKECRIYGTEEETD